MFRFVAGRRLPSFRVVSRSRNRRNRPRAIGRGMECMEDRCLMAVGAIHFNDSTGVITVDGTDSTADRAFVTILPGTLHNSSDDIVRVELQNTGSPLVREFYRAPFSLLQTPLVFGLLPGGNVFNYPGVTEVRFNGYGGNDLVDNQSSVRLRAYGGAGNDTILGGSAADIFLGGPGNDFMDGRLGDDMMWGEAGTDAIFGDEGIDMILGGADNDYLFGGNGADALYGEGGNDWLFGGAGADNLLDSSGQNVLKQDYGVTNVLVNGFETWDWFDRNLENPSLRSLVRVKYQDRSLQRTDLLAIYSQVSTDNYVSTSEFNDLKDLTSTNLSMWNGYRSLAKKVAYGDRANSWYQGGTLGNLAAGSTGARLNNLVNKWFLGLDRPTAAAGTTYRYVSGNLFQTIQYTDVDQEGAADCYFLAPLAEVAQQSPQIILNMFTDNGDGTYMVRFYRGGTPEYVTVDRFLPVDSDGTSRYAGFGGKYWQSTNELWVALAEKAYAQINESNWISQDGTNSYAGIDFGSMTKAMEHITGRSSSTAPILGGPFGSLIRDAVISANNQGKAITFSSFDDAGDVDNNIVANHVYTLAGYDSATQKFRLFNPWGFNNSKPGEVFLTWSQIAANFGSFAVTSLT